MGKIIVDQLQRAGQTAFQLPSTDTAGGGLVQTDGSGNISVANTVPSGAESAIETIAEGAIPGALPTASKVYDFNATNVATLDVSWTDILPTGKTFANDVAMVKLEGSGISAAGVGTFRFYGKDGSGAITTGYLGHSYDGSYYGNQSQGSGHNSNNGWWQIPMYTSVESTAQSYGGGITFSVIWHPHVEDTYGNYQVMSNCVFRQNNQTYPNTEQTAWFNYNTNVPPAAATHGFTMTNSATGNIDRGYLRVELVLK